MMGLPDRQVTQDCRDRWMPGCGCEHSLGRVRLLTEAFMTPATAWSGESDG